ncbi:MAG: cystathionine beta-synthase [Chloroflexi bacterium]|nr:cystathionine beta-synthase [Chloroflexota bacterium]
MSSTGLPFSESLRVYNDITETIGKTPLVRLNHIGRGLPCPLYAKIEFFNPGGSVKDRIAINMIKEAEDSGRLKPGGTVVESTSGNTGIGLAIICALRGYKSIFVMPDKMSQEKILLLRAYGGKVIITPTAVAPDDPRSYYSVADKIVEETPNSFLANQYHNPENPRSHYETTGPEIWEQTGGKVTDVVIGLGTGGTITGAGRYLKEKNPDINMVGVDPTGSIILEIWQNKGKIPEGVEAITYKVEGIGEDFLPSATDLSVIDDIVRVTDKESFLMARRLVREEGIFGGGSCGSAVAAALRYSKDLPPERLVVVLLPDSGSRYLSKVFDDKWMRENGFLESEWGEVSLRELLSEKRIQELITASVDDTIMDVIGMMKKHDISQIPAVNPDGSIAGLVREVDLLKYMLESDQQHSAKATIKSILQPTPQSFPAHTRLENVMPAVVEGNVVLVKDGDNLVGIISKIDILDFISH